MQQHSRMCLIILFFLSHIANIFAASPIVNLIVSYKTVNFAGKQVNAIAVNNQIPAPTLHFKKGDHVTINVYNHLPIGTSIHWHGVLVPWQMDGVEGVSQKAIPPGDVFHYQFTLYQSGTYWYHAHTGLQEQQGLYGGIIIDPLKPPHYKYTKDFMIVLSDWSNTNPNKIYANLKKDGDYYSPRFPLQPSLLRFIHDYRHATTETERQKIIENYKMMQHMRMGIYDFSDVAYDTFLLNGHSPQDPWTALVKVGDIVRLRFIGAASGTIFHIKIPDSSLQMVHVQGNDIKPYTIHDFTIAPGETYDVLVKIQKNNPYIIYAESADKVGAAYGALITNPQQFINYHAVVPFPDPQPVSMEHMGMSNMQHNSMHMQNNSMQMQHNPMQMNAHDSHSMHTMSHAMHASNQTTLTKYQNLTAAVKTNDPTKPVHIIKMELSGWMNHFIWFINDLPEYKAQPILIKSGERYRIIFINKSMMHHPMHIHGHWLILRNGHGDHDPLLHTIDVPPGATVITDFDAKANGQWFFHCHFIYHMAAGMSRVFQYTSLFDGDIKENNQANYPQNIYNELINHPMAHPQGFYLANFLDFGEDPFHNVQEVTFKGLYGGDYNKLELFTNDAEFAQGSVENADMDIFYWHLISQFWAIKGGVNYFYELTERAYLQPGIGIEGLMPYFIDTDERTYYHNGSTKFDLELSRDTQISNNFFIRTGIRGIFATKTVIIDGVGNGLNQMRYTFRPYYRLLPGLSVFTEYEHDQAYGAFKNILRHKNESSSENTVTFGFSFLV